jgi:molybdenum cofactor guanylyltransferase
MNENNQLISCIILAGGKSSRMGRDKALISIHGVPMLTYICQIALQCTNDVYIVTSFSEKYQDFIPNNCHLISEIKPSGPVGGFYQGLQSIHTEWVLLLACDLPLLNDDILQEWICQLSQVPEKAIALLAKNPKGWESLCGFYRQSCIFSLSEYINQGGKSFQKWLEQNYVQELQTNHQKIFFNCNTPDDLKLIR